MNRKKEGIEETAIQKVNKKAKIMVPLIFMLILTIIIPTIIYVGKNIIQQPTETAEIEKQEELDEEKISAASVRVEAGYSYTVPKDGIYQIRVHGGKSKDLKVYSSTGSNTTILGNKGSMLSGILSLEKDQTIHVEESNFGMLSGGPPRGNGVRVLVDEEDVCHVSGGPGVSVTEKNGNYFFYCNECISIWKDSNFPGELELVRASIDQILPSRKVTSI